MTEPYALFAGSALALVVLTVWGFGEATVLPVVPDVLLGILVLAAPAQAPLLLAVTLAGGVVGGLALWALLRHRPKLARAILCRQPALGEPGMAEARHRILRHGKLCGIAQIGPGLPLKAYLAALAQLAPNTGCGRVALLAGANRLTRIGPVVLACALAAPLVAGIDLAPEVFGAVYALGWAAFYAAYWISRDPRRRASATRPGPGA